ncbi:MAG: FHA domain-containing protein [Sinobacteraceae bacterium]|nr:FHA domain-containing protein [Nevskiaceae bacterium]MBV8852938.1 FHA domain-containing protein [Nevskiaceae bacterium]
MDHGSEHSHEPAADGTTRLLIRVDGDTEVVHVLGRKTSVGRTPDNDLQIDAKFISRHHAVILSGPTHAIIEDLNSTNGVLVNNRRVTRQPLKDGDNVMIGKTQFRFVVRGSKG